MTKQLVSFLFLIAATAGVYGMENKKKDPWALWNAAREGDLARVQELVKQGEDINNDNQFWTPLCEAVVCKHYDIVQYLLEQGANPDKDCPLA